MIAYKSKDKQRAKQELISYNGKYGDSICIEWEGDFPSVIEKEWHLSGFPGYDNNYNFRLSQLAKGGEDAHFFRDLFRRPGDVGFLVAVKFVVHKQLTPLSFLEDSFNKDISYIHQMVKGQLPGKKSRTKSSKLMRRNLKTNKNTLIVDQLLISVGVEAQNGIIKGVNRNKNIGINTKDILNEKQMKYKNYLKDHKRSLMEIANFVDNNLKERDLNDIALFNIKVDVDFNSLDRNFHVNMAYYIEFIENCLMEYNSELSKGYWFISECCCIFVKELKLEKINNNQYRKSQAEVVIISDQVFNHNNNYKQIYGVIQQFDSICCKFMCIIQLNQSSTFSNL